MKNITVIGTGYVGLVSGAGLSDFGNQVVCADIDESKIRLLNAGKIPIFEPGLKEVVDRNVKSKRLSFTTDVSKAVRDAEVIFIGVGTPEGKNGEADLSAVFSVAETIGNNLNAYKIICTKSTVPIGTGKKIISIINKYKNNDVNFDSSNEMIDGFTLTEDLTPANIAPVLDINNFALNEAATTSITSTMLSASDVDGADNGIVFNISAVSGGQFELTGNPGFEVANFGDVDGQTGITQLDHFVVVVYLGLDFQVIPDVLPGADNKIGIAIALGGHGSPYRSRRHAEPRLRVGNAEDQVTAGRERLKTPCNMQA